MISVRYHQIIYRLSRLATTTGVGKTESMLDTACSGDVPKLYIDEYELQKSPEIPRVPLLLEDVPQSMLMECVDKSGFLAGFAEVCLQRWSSASNMWEGVDVDALTSGKLDLADILHCPCDGAPRVLKPDEYIDVDLDSEALRLRVIAYAHLSTAVPRVKLLFRLDPAKGFAGGDIPGTAVFYGHMGCAAKMPSSSHMATRADVRLLRSAPLRTLERDAAAVKLQSARDRRLNNNLSLRGPPVLRVPPERRVPNPLHIMLGEIGRIFKLLQKACEFFDKGAGNADPELAKIAREAFDAYSAGTREKATAESERDELRRERSLLTSRISAAESAHTAAPQRASRAHAAAAAAVEQDAANAGEDSVEAYLTHLDEQLAELNAGLQTAAAEIARLEVTLPALLKTLQDADSCVDQGAGPATHALQQWQRANSVSQEQYGSRNLAGPAAKRFCDRAVSLLEAIRSALAQSDSAKTEEYKHRGVAPPAGEVDRESRWLVASEKFGEVLAGLAQIFALSGYARELEDHEVKVVVELCPKLARLINKVMHYANSGFVDAMEEDEEEVDVAAAGLSDSEEEEGVGSDLEEVEGARETADAEGDEASSTVVLKRWQLAVVVPEFVRRFRTLGIMNESVLEAFHALVNRVLRNYANLRGEPQDRAMRLGVAAVCHQGARERAIEHEKAVALPPRKRDEGDE